MSMLRDGRHWVEDKSILCKSMASVLREGKVHDAYSANETDAYFRNTISSSKVSSFRAPGFEWTFHLVLKRRKLPQEIELREIQRGVIEAVFLKKQSQPGKACRCG